MTAQEGRIAQFYPVMLRLEGVPVLVVGGGAVGSRKALALLAAGAQVLVVAPSVTERLLAEAGGRLSVALRSYLPADLAGRLLVVAATDSPALNSEITAEARRRGIWVNNVSERGESSFWNMPALSWGPLGLAVTTGGEAPAFARAFAEWLAGEPSAQELARVLAGLRGLTAAELEQRGLPLLRGE